MLRVATGLAVVVGLAGCFFKPDPPGSTSGDGGIGGGDGGAGGDARGAGDSGMPCVGIVDDFDTGTGCDPWGSVYSSAQVSRNNKQLLVTTPAPMAAPGTAAATGTPAAAYGGCRSGLFDFSAGTSVQIVSVGGGMTDDYAEFSVTSSDGTLTAGIRITQMSSTDGFPQVYPFVGTTPSGGIHYNSASMAWWRIKAVTAGTTQLLIAYASDPPVGWTDLFMLDLGSTPIDQFRVNLLAGSTDGVSDVPVTFDNLGAATCTQ